MQGNNQQRNEIYMTYGTFLKIKEYMQKKTRKQINISITNSHRKVSWQHVHTIQCLNLQTTSIRYIQ